MKLVMPLYVNNLTASISHFRPSKRDGESKNITITDQIAINIVVDVCYYGLHIVTCNVVIGYL